MFTILQNMIESSNPKYTNAYIEERIETFYLVDKITKEEYLSLKEMLNRR